MKRASETLHALAFEILKAKYDLNNLSTVEIHKTYREIYDELQQAEENYVNANLDEKYLK